MAEPSRFGRPFDQCRHSRARQALIDKIRDGAMGEIPLIRANRIGDQYVSWTPEKDQFSPWQYEWNDFLHNIRHDLPHNEAQRAAYSDLTTLMGRAACHTGQIVTWDDMMKSRFQFCDYLDDLNFDSPAPVKADADGRFPVPIPGQWQEV